MSALEGAVVPRAISSQYEDEERGEDLRLIVRGPDARQAPGRDLVGGLVRQPRLAARSAAVRPRRGRERATERHGQDQRSGGAVDAVRRARLAAPAARSVSSRPALGRRRRGAEPPAAAAELRGGPVRPAARPPLAAHVLQRHHRRRPRAARGQRARGGRWCWTSPTSAGARRRWRRRRRPRPAAVARSPGCRSEPGGHVRSQRSGGDRLRCRRSDRRADRADRRRAAAWPRRYRRPGAGGSGAGGDDRDTLRRPRRGAAIA